MHQFSKKNLLSFLIDLDVDTDPICSTEISDTVNFKLDLCIALEKKAPHNKERLLNRKLDHKVSLDEYLGQTLHHELHNSLSEGINFKVRYIAFHRPNRIRDLYLDANFATHKKIYLKCR